MKRIIAAVSAACLLGQTAYAFDNVSVQFGGGRINVSASLGDTQAGSAVKLILLKPGATGVNAETLAALNEIYVGAGGEFSFDEKLPQDAAGGEYRVILTSGGGERFEGGYIYMTDDFLADKLNELNGLDAAATAQWLAENGGYFELDLGGYEGLSENGRNYADDALCKTDFSVREDFSDLQEKRQLIKDVFADAVFVAEANDVDDTDADGVQKFFAENLDRIKLKDSVKGYLEDFTAEENKKLLCEVFAGDFEKAEEIAAKCQRLAVLLKISKTTHWSEVEEIFGSEADILSPDTSLMAKVGEESLYLAYGVCVGKSFSDTDAAVAAFEKKLRQIIDDRSKSDSGSGSGGSGSTGGSSGGGGGSKPSGSIGAVFTPVITPEQQESETDEDMFSDLEQAAWAKPYINRLARQKVINGYGDGRFGPADYVTRGQFAKITVDAFGVKSEESRSMHFADVGAEDIFRESIEILYDTGIVSGISENEFGIGSSITREDACVLIAGVFDKLRPGLLGGGAADFADANLISGYARDAVSRLAGAQLIAGSDGYFNPKNYITRAELAKIICFGIDKIMEVEAK